VHDPVPVGLAAPDNLDAPGTVADNLDARLTVQT
jgi:hypothetical protein